ncbi:aminopeptidase [Halobium salinum]|uniref:Aminopeptidase n=1 Tax=Halobium salinum TaxID=1364940 RepID=A0ABD5P6D0_9EURY|nr:aminopeptidase [Halobium salinum]
MDPRIEEHAEILVDYSIEAEAGDEVVLMAPREAEDLAVAVSGLLGKRGANVTHLGGSARRRRAYLRASDPESFETSEVALAAFETADAFIGIGGATNAHETSDVPPETTAAYGRAQKPIQEAYLDTDWVGTQYPTPADAQTAGMSTEAYEEFVWNAVNRDWEEQREYQEGFVDVLDPADEVRIVSGDTTDVTLDVSGMRACNDHGRINVPAGEVFTAPNRDGVDGEVLFDLPVITRGHEVEAARLVFEDGVVVEHSAETNEEALTAQLNTDEGSNRLGELGIGMNRGIDRFTKNILFDEKMGDTVHMAIGMAYEECVPEGKERNDSSVHTDMLVDMSEDSHIEIDGEVVQRNGRFFFEDGFE